MGPRLLAVAALLVAASGCSAPLTTREKGALAGGAIGAGAGAAIGSTSGHTGTGALIGAGVGVVSGVLIGDAIQGAEQNRVAQSPPPPTAPPPTHVVVAPPPPVVAAPRTIHVPPGHYPPSGHCRLWYAGRPPGHQPPPVRCERVAVAPGAFILYNGTAWDGGYDWRGHARRHPGSVPRVIIDVTSKR